MTLILGWLASSAIASASGWQNFTPYQADVAAAFSRVQNEVFASGKYYRRNKRQKAKSIDDLRRLNGEEGTHSILDVRQVVTSSPPPERFFDWLQRYVNSHGATPPREEIAARTSVVYRAPDAWLARVFGTPRPSHADVSRSTADLNEVCERGNAIYFTVYDANGPSEIAFWGISGD